jgi:HSP20 family protein
MNRNLTRRNAHDNPYLEIERFRNDFDSFFDDFASYNRSENSNFGKVLEEKESYFLATIDMPGVGHDDINIFIDQNILKVNANRVEGDRTFDYSTSLMLPRNVDHDEIKAMYENGVLKMALPKTGKAQEKKIELSNDDNKGFFKSLFSSDKNVDVIQ